MCPLVYSAEICTEKILMKILGPEKEGDKW